MFRATAFSLLASAAMAQGLTGSRYLISETDIVKELGGSGITVDISQVHIPMHMTATIASPKLEIVTAEPVGDKHVRLELRCSTVAECLPFFATVDVKDPNAVISGIQSKAGLVAAVGHQTTGPMGGEPKDRQQLRVGTHAMLEIRDGHLDIHLQVLAIDTGTIGQQVRVSTLDRKKVFHATITGDGTVMGVME
jgi:hypothetical protein